MNAMIACKRGSFLFLAVAAGFRLAAAQVGSVPAPPVKVDVALRAFGSSPSQLTVERIAVAGPALAPEAPVLTDATFLPIAFSGQVEGLAFDSSMPRVVEVAPGIQALRLPGPAGTLVLHYRRSGTVFGFLGVSARGDARVLMERPGIGSGGQTDPFDRSLGVARDGATVAVSAPTFSQGLGGHGDVWIARPAGPKFPSGDYAVELSGALVVDADGASLTFKGAWLYGVVDDALRRAPADGSGPFLQVVLPPSGGASNLDLVDEFALSADGSTLALLAGVDEALVDLYVIDGADQVKNLTQAPAKIEPPGYLPGKSGGPLLQLSPDGSLIAYQIEFANGAELYLRDTAGASAPVHVTGDVAFDQSIDTVSGILGSALTMRFFARGGAAGADLYSATLLQTGLELKNLTATSGASAPFFPNAATIDVGASWQLGPQRLVFDAPAPGADQLWRVDGAGAAAVLVPALAAPPAIAAGTNRWLALFATPAGSSVALLFDASGAAPLPLIALSGGFALTGSALRADDRKVALSAVGPGSSAEVLGLVDLVNGAVVLVGSTWQQPRDASFSGGGRLLFHAATGGGQQGFAANPLTGSTRAFGAPAPVAFWIN